MDDENEKLKLMKNSHEGTQRAIDRTNEIPFLDMPEELVKIGQRISELEKIHYCDISSNQLDKCIIRARRSVEQKQCYSAQWKWVPSNYYDLNLSQRAELLSAFDTRQLCKVVLMENRNYDSTVCTNEQFFLIVVQYDATISTQKLQREVRCLRPPKTRLDVSKFNFRLANEVDNDRLTGYQHNSVSPFGLLPVAAQNGKCVPIILSAAIVKTVNFIWMGGGHVDLKLGMSINDFSNALKPLILDVSDER